MYFHSTSTRWWSSEWWKGRSEYIAPCALVWVKGRWLNKAICFRNDGIQHRWEIKEIGMFDPWSLIYLFTHTSCPFLSVCRKWVLWRETRWWTKKCVFDRCPYFDCFTVCWSKLFKPSQCWCRSEYWMTKEGKEREKPKTELTID